MWHETKSVLFWILSRLMSLWVAISMIETWKLLLMKRKESRRIVHGERSGMNERRLVGSFLPPPHSHFGDRSWNRVCSRTLQWRPREGERRSRQSQYQVRLPLYSTFFLNQTPFFQKFFRNFFSSVILSSFSSTSNDPYLLSSVLPIFRLYHPHSISITFLWLSPWWTLIF